MAEAREISFFMTRLKDEDRTPDLDEADMKQWARYDAHVYTI